MNRESFWLTGVPWRPIAKGRAGVLRNTFWYFQLPRWVQGEAGELWSWWYTWDDNSNYKAKPSWAADEIDSASHTNGIAPSTREAMTDSGHKYCLPQSQLFDTWCLTFDKKKLGATQKFLEQQWAHCEKTKKINRSRHRDGPDVELSHREFKIIILMC